MTGLIYRIPAVGFALFIFYNTGLQGFLEKIEFLKIGFIPIKISDLGILTAMAVLFFNNIRNKSSVQKTNIIEIVVWILTIAIYISKIYQMDTPQFTTIAAQILACMFWAPLFMVFRRMGPAQQSACKKIIIFASAITAFLTIWIVATRSAHLYHTLSINRFSNTADPRSFVYARVTLPGFWTVLPFGFWFCLNRLFNIQRWLSAEAVLYGASGLVMLIAILVNLTRALLLGVAAGFFTIAILGFLFLNNRFRKRLLILGAVFSILLLLAGPHGKDLRGIWIERFEDKPWESASIVGRMDQNKVMLETLFRELFLFGDRKSWGFGIDDISTGDPHTAIQVWWRYGLIALVAFLLLMAILFMKLMRILIFKKYYSQEALMSAIFLLACYFQFHMSMASGDYLFKETVFVLLFFAAEVDRISHSYGRSQRRRYETVIT